MFLEEYFQGSIKHTLFFCFNVYIQSHLEDEEKSHPLIFVVNLNQVEKYEI